MRSRKVPIKVTEISGSSSGGQCECVAVDRGAFALKLIGAVVLGMGVLS